MERDHGPLAEGSASGGLAGERSRSALSEPGRTSEAIPTITDALDARRRITRQSFQKTPSSASRVGNRKPPTKLAPKKISVARLPVTGSDVFGREEDVTFLDDVWANQHVNVVTIVA